MDKWKDRICEIINDVDTNVLDVFFLLISECLKGAMDVEQRFQYIIENAQRKTFSNKGESLYVSQNIINNNEEQYTKELSDYIRVLSERNYSSEEFYGILYRHVFNGELYPKETAIQSYLLYLLAERIPGIPYYQTKNLLKLPNDEYKAIVDKIQPQIQKAIAMMNRNFEFKTEESSQLYYISQDITSEEDKIVYWSVVMNIMRIIGQKGANREEIEVE